MRPEKPTESSASGDPWGIARQQKTSVRLPLTSIRKLVVGTEARCCSGVQKAGLRQLAALTKAQSLLPRLLLSLIAFVLSEIKRKTVQ